jgi:hypothetical protein
MIETKSLKSPEDKVVTRQICVKETKNLAAEQQILQVPQKSEMELKGAIVEFIWQLKKENKSEDTIRAYDYALKQIVGIGINLFNPVLPGQNASPKTVDRHQKIQPHKSLPLLPKPPQYRSQTNQI